MKKLFLILLLLSSCVKKEESKTKEKDEFEVYLEKKKREADQRLEAELETQVNEGDVARNEEVEEIEYSDSLDFDPANRIEVTAYKNIELKGGEYVAKIYIIKVDGIDFLYTYNGGLTRLR